MSKGLISGTLGLLGGASLGAIAMYLMDPDHGEGRRAELANSANDALGSTADAVKATWSTASDSARTAASATSDYAQSVASKVGSHVKNRVAGLTGDAGDAANSVHGSASDAVDSVKDAIGTAVKSVKGFWSRTADRTSDLQDDLTDRAQSHYAAAKAAVQKKADAIQGQTGLTATGITIGTVGVLAAGAAAMYLLDSAKGANRRAQLKEVGGDLARRAGYLSREFGRHIGERARGVLTETAGVDPIEANGFGGDYPSNPSAASI